MQIANNLVVRYARRDSNSIECVELPVFGMIMNFVHKRWWKMKWVVSAVIIGLAVMGCSKSEKKESISYDFTENGCPTGNKTFSSVAEMCKGLQDDELNNHCAEASREAHFKQNCSGSFRTESPNPREDFQTSGTGECQVNKISDHSFIEEIKIKEQTNITTPILYFSDKQEQVSKFVHFAVSLQGKIKIIQSVHNSVGADRDAGLDRSSSTAGSELLLDAPEADARISCTF
jgi:hypothetical protein